MRKMSEHERLLPELCSLMDQLVKCRCGACYECLRRAGSLTSMAADVQQAPCTLSDGKHDFQPDVSTLRQSRNLMGTGGLQVVCRVCGEHNC